MLIEVGMLGFLHKYSLVLNNDEVLDHALLCDNRQYPYQPKKECKINITSMTIVNSSMITFFMTIVNS